MTDFVIWLHGTRHALAYCPVEDCALRVELVKGSIRDLESPGAKTWRKTKGAVQ